MARERRGAFRNRLGQSVSGHLSDTSGPGRGRANLKLELFQVDNSTAMSPSTESSRLSRRSTKQASGGGGARRRRSVVLWRLDSVLAAPAAALYTLPRPKTV